MNIIAHRGFWKHQKEQNTLRAFRRAVDAGFGIETDIRDFNKRLVITHDLPSSQSLLAEDAFKVFAAIPQKQILALNVKSDGLQTLVLQLLKKHKIKNYFIFDTSLPDAFGYLRKRMHWMTRMSEYESSPSLLSAADGIWVDSFTKDWFDLKILQKHLTAGKDVCIVSPELHHRRYQHVWKLLNSHTLKKFSNQISLCTDFPLQAKDFFETKKHQNPPR